MIFIEGVKLHGGLKVRFQ